MRTKSTESSATESSATAPPTRLPPRAPIRHRACLHTLPLRQHKARKYKPHNEQVDSIRVERYLTHTHIHTYAETNCQARTHTNVHTYIYTEEEGKGRSGEEKGTQGGCKRRAGCECPACASDQIHLKALVLYPLDLCAHANTHTHTHTNTVVSIILVGGHKSGVKSSQYVTSFFSLVT